MTSPHPPERASATLRAIPRIDLDTASRDKLVAHIEHLEWVVAAVYPDGPVIEALRRLAHFTKAEAVIVAVLMKGRYCSQDYLRVLALRDDTSESNVLQVHLVRVRRKLRALGVTLECARRIGWRLSDADIEHLHSLLSERAAA